MNLDELSVRRVAVWGLGREGTGVLRLLRARGQEPVLVDDDPVGTDVAVGAEVVAPGEMDWSATDVVVRSPGVSRYRPELAAAEHAGAKVTTAMAVWLADYADAPMVAVTGTKGKSTTASLTAAILRATGRTVDLVGNIGVPVTETYDRPQADAYVVEVSSYQAVDVTTTPKVCVLTSLAPDHLDWHGGMEAYYRDKLRLLRAGSPGALAVNAASDDAVSRTADHHNRLLYGPSGRVLTDHSGVVRADGHPMVEAGALRVPGRHNRWNLCGAIAGVLLLDGGLPPAEAVAKAVDEFGGLPSRCQVIGENGEVTYVDDALASNPFATLASVDAFEGRHLTLVSGGADRGVDMTALALALAERVPVPTVMLVGAGGLPIAEAVAHVPGGDRVNVTRTETLEEAVQQAASSTPPGGVVLFSPAQPTPTDEGDFRARSRRFAAAAGLGPTTGGPVPARGADSAEGGNA
jgi:UDP-N-acetylmuramoyl-L-alanine---L-glutamate ligase